MTGSARPPRVSVVLPVRDRAATLARAMDSVLGQDFGDLELLVVDDASSDGSSEIAERIGRADRRVRLLRLDRPGGAAAARNAAAGQARGALLAFQDSDDEWLPGGLAALVEALDRAPAGVAVAHGRAEGVAIAPGGMLAGNTIPLIAAVVRRAAFERVGGFDQRLPRLMDWDLWLRLMREHGFVAVDAVVGRASQAPGRISDDPEALRLALGLILDSHVAAFAAEPRLLARHLRLLARLNLGAGAGAAARVVARRALRAEPSPRSFLCVLDALAGPAWYRASRALAQRAARQSR